ncbi:MAG: cysteine desulfurase, partial [Phaeobacter italicus]
TWTWLATALLFLGVIILSSLGLEHEGDEAFEEAKLSGTALVMANAEGFEDVHEIVLGRCSMCHAREPFWDGIRTAPKGVLLETEADVASRAHEIYLQAGVTHAMPPANITYMEPEDRAAIRAWFRAAQM